MAREAPVQPGSAVPVEAVSVSAYRVPTDAPESDGTLEWDSTTLVLVEIAAGGKTGLGFTYGHQACEILIADKLADVVKGRDAMATGECWLAMVAAIRNLGRAGICSMAIAAVDIALWDLKARLLEQPLATLLGQVHAEIPVYGSGGFTSYSVERLEEQLSGWVEAGIPRVKMKVGRHPDRDLARVQAARAAIGPDAALLVDANGAYDRKQALTKAEAFADEGVSWYEEPVTSDDPAGLRLIRDRAPAGMDITTGEYGYDLPYFQRTLEAGAVDVLQADVTRCAGITEFLRVGALCEAHKVGFSTHTAPSLHLHPACAVKQLRHVEYFHDHVRVEQMLFDGAAQPEAGVLRPDLSRPGLGLELKRADAKRYAL